MNTKYTLAADPIPDTRAYNFVFNSEEEQKEYIKLERIKCTHQWKAFRTAYTKEEREAARAELIKHRHLAYRLWNVLNQPSLGESA